MKPPRIAFLGLGLMGSGMAHRLIAGGFSVTVFNRNQARAASHAAAGARVVTTARAAAEGAEFIVSMVADDIAARAVWLGDDGALAGAAPGAVAVESSTVTPGWVRELAAAAAEKHMELIDAPVTGSRTHAAAGELKFLVGGTPETLEKVRPVLTHMGRSIVRVGPLGSGALLKVINNFLCGVHVAALAEAVAMIERSGLERATALEVVTGGAAGSPIVGTVAARMTAADYAPHFLLRLMAKDLAYATAIAKTLKLDLDMARAASVLFQNGIAAGEGERDIAAVVEPLRNHRP